MKYLLIFIALMQWMALGTIGAEESDTNDVQESLNEDQASTPTSAPPTQYGRGFFFFDGALQRFRRRWFAHKEPIPLYAGPAYPLGGYYNCPPYGCSPSYPSANYEPSNLYGHYPPPYPGGYSAPPGPPYAAPQSQQAQSQTQHEQMQQSHHQHSNIIIYQQPQNQRGNDYYGYHVQDQANSAAAYNNIQPPNPIPGHPSQLPPNQSAVNPPPLPPPPPPQIPPPPLPPQSQPPLPMIPPPQSHPGAPHQVLPGPPNSLPIPPQPYYGIPAQPVPAYNVAPYGSHYDESQAAYHHQYNPLPASPQYNIATPPNNLYYGQTAAHPGTPVTYAAPYSPWYGQQQAQHPQAHLPPPPPPPSSCPPPPYPCHVGR